MSTHPFPIQAPHDAVPDSLVEAVANMLFAHFTGKQISAALGLPMEETMRLVGMAGQTSSPSLLCKDDADL